ncbi:MAG: hypothetical protein AAF889_08820 [Cyanobacteria bacterium P01_D01_bin.73]
MGKEYEGIQEFNDRRRRLEGKNEPSYYQELSEKDWYIVALEDGCCDVMSVLEGQQQPESKGTSSCRIWGPFKSYEGAIARRIGLIRSGKCKPY